MPLLLVVNFVAPVQTVWKHVTTVNAILKWTRSDEAPRMTFPGVFNLLRTSKPSPLNNYDFRKFSFGARFSRVKIVFFSLSSFPSRLPPFSLSLSSPPLTPAHLFIAILHVLSRACGDGICLFSHSPYSFIVVAMPRWIGFPCGTVFGVRRPTVRRREREMASLLR